VDPVPDPLLLRKCGNAGNRTRDPWVNLKIHRKKMFGESDKFILYAVCEELRCIRRSRAFISLQGMKDRFVVIIIRYKSQIQRICLWNVFHFSLFLNRSHFRIEVFGAVGINCRVAHVLCLHKPQASDITDEFAACFLRSIMIASSQSTSVISVSWPEWHPDCRPLCTWVLAVCKNYEWSLNVLIVQYLWS
jgi:hypothetical protein